MTPQEALTQAGKDYWLKTEFDWEREAILDIEQEAAQQKHERLRAIWQKVPRWREQGYIVVRADAVDALLADEERVDE